jgi:hypothetical protein
MNKSFLSPEFAQLPMVDGTHTAETITAMFFGPYTYGEADKPSKLMSTFKAFVSGIDMTPDHDSINKARLALQEHGFSQMQTGSFMGVVQNAVARIVFEYGQYVHGAEYETGVSPLDLYYGSEFFMGVKIEGQRLDKHYSRAHIHTTIQIGMERLMKDFPSLFVPDFPPQIPSVKPGMAAAPRP